MARWLTQIDAVLIRWIIWIVLAINITSIGASLYLFRYAIYCGLGVGSYSLFIYVPSFILVVSTYFYTGGGAVAKARNYTFVVNAVYIAFLLIEGVCFSCVNTCVESFQK
jgi:hypothetical protein